MSGSSPVTLRVTSMIYKFNRKGENFGVYNEQGELKYTVKLTTEYSFYAEIFDELAVSQLADIKVTEKGYLISAFDSPVGLLRKTENGYASENGDITLVDKGERGFLAEVLGDNARIVTSGNSVAIQTENEAGAMLVVALGLMLLAEKKEVEEQIVPIAKETQKPTRKIDINFKSGLDKFFTFVGKIVSSGGKIILEKRRVNGKLAVAFFGGIALAVVMFITGIIGASVNTNKAKKYQQTNAMVYVLNKEAVARFQVGGYYYKIETSPKYKTGYQMPVYYTLDKKGRVDSCTFKKPSAAPYIVLSAIGAASALTLAFLVFFGIPKLPKNAFKEQEVYSETEE